MSDEKKRCCANCQYSSTCKLSNPTNCLRVYCDDYQPNKQTRKVKFLGYISDSGYMVYIREGIKCECRRVPSEDKTVEVEE